MSELIPDYTGSPATPIKRYLNCQVGQNAFAEVLLTVNDAGYGFARLYGYADVRLTVADLLAWIAAFRAAAVALGWNDPEEDDGK